MKKLISLLLLCSLVFSLFAFSANAEEFDEYALMEHTLSFVDEISTADTRAIVMPEPPVNEEDVSLIVTSPLTSEPCCMRGDKLPIRSLLLSTGAPEQYYCVAIYYTYYQFLEEEPLALFVSPFPEEAGLYATRVEWDTSKANRKVYSYHAVLFTATKRGNDLVPVEGTLSMENISIKDYSYPVKELYFYDLDMENQLPKLCVAKDDVAGAIASFGSYGSYTCTEDLKLRLEGDCAVVEDYAGLLYCYGLDYGWATLVVSIGEAKERLPIEVCVSADGHTDEQTVIIEPTEQATGLVRHYCSICGATYDETVRLTPLVEDIFADVEADDWYCSALQFVYDRGLFNGVSATRFAPDKTMTRAELVTVFHRYAADSEDYEGENVFTDVHDGTWYTNAVLWAASEGIVNGVGGGKFDPNGNITREQLATILYRYSISAGMDVTVDGDFSSFADAADVSDYAKDAMAWAVSKGLINGTKTGSGEILLSPGSNATRAQVAAIMMRYINS